MLYHAQAYACADLSLTPNLNRLRKDEVDNRCLVHLSKVFPLLQKRLCLPMWNHTDFIVTVYTAYMLASYAVLSLSCCLIVS